MIRLIAPLFTLAFRRLVPGPIRAALGRWAVPVTLAVLIVAEVGLTWLAATMTDDDDPVTAFVLAPMTAFVLIVAAGVSVISTEATAPSRALVERSLHPLPLTLRAMGLLAWTPAFALATAMVLLVLPPACAVLAALGHGPVAIAGIVASTLAIGTANATLATLVGRVALRSARWRAVRTPATVLLWFAVLVAEGALSFQVAPGGGDPVRAAFLAPAVLDALGRSESPSGSVVAISVAVGVVAVVALVATAVGSTALATSRIRAPWSGAGALARIGGELRYALRDPGTAGNVLTAVTVTTAILALSLAFSDPVLTFVGPTLVLTTLVVACIPARMLRGSFPARRPVQRLLGMAPAAWARSQALVALAVTLIALAPVAVLASRAGPPSLQVLVVGTPAALAVALVLGWLWPVLSDDVMGQILGGTTFTALALGVAFGATRLADASLLAGVSASLLFLLVSLALARVVEVRRWKPSVSPN